MAMPQGQAPFIRTPLTDFSAMFGLIDIQIYGRPQCKKFEMKYFNCLEAYGLEKGADKCADIYEDLLECKFAEKQRARASRIREEIEKQVAEGKNSYTKSPNIDSYYEVRL